MTDRELVLDSYIYRGHLLKKVGQDIQPYLPGVVCGLVGEVESEDMVVIYKLTRDKGVTATPFLSWTPEGVVKTSPSPGIELEYLVPKGRSRGFFLTQIQPSTGPSQLLKSPTGIDWN